MAGPALHLDKIEPMLLCEVPRPFTREGWAFELKYDGWRCLAEVRDGRVRLQTRRGHDATRWWPEVVRGLETLAGHHVLDGEVSVLDGQGRSDFQRLQARSDMRGWKPGADPVVFCAFDLLVHDGEVAMGYPLRQRKLRLERLLAPMPDSVIQVRHIEREGEWLFERALALDVEGIVAKDLASPYQPGLRSRHWLKIMRPDVVPAGQFEVESAATPAP